MIARAAAAILLALVPIAGCGNERETTRFEHALSAVSPTVDPAGTGFGWLDVRALKRTSGAEAVTDAASALGPGADELLEDHRRLRHSIGVDPLRADEAVSLGGSYAFAARLDGVAPGRLPGLLRRAGAREERVGEWTEFDLGNEAEATTHGPLTGLSAFASRTATTAAGVIVARTEATRSSLIGGAGTVLDEAGTRFAAACLGEVVAARTVPGSFTHSPRASPDLLAFAARAGVAGREVLCAIDDSEAEAQERAEAMEAAFAPGARDAVTDEKIGHEVENASVDTMAEGGLHAARAELTLAPGAEGLLFSAFARGSLITYTGVGAPISDPAG